MTLTLVYSTAAEQLRGVNDSMTNLVMGGLQKLIGEWTISKSIQMTLTDRMGKERAKVKHEMQLKIDKIKEDFNAMKVCGCHE